LCVAKTLKTNHCQQEKVKCGDIKPLLVLNIIDQAPWGKYTAAFAGSSAIT